MEQSNDLLVESLLEQSENQTLNNELSGDKVSDSDNSGMVVDVDTPNEDRVLGETSKDINKPVKHLKLPFSKIKHIMKMDPDVQLVQHDAVFLVSKATELFIEFLSKETAKQLSGNKRKTVMKRDVDVTIESIAQLCFLDGALE